MGKLYKIFGAVAIIGLSLLCSMSTGLAAQGQQQQQQQLVWNSMYDDFQVAEYNDSAYAISGYESYGFTAPYQPSPITSPDLCTVLVARYRVLGGDLRVFVVNMNIGLSQSSGAQAIVRVYDHGVTPVLYDEENVGALHSFIFSTFSTPRVSLSSGLHLVSVHLKLNAPLEEGIGLRAINWRFGLILGPL